MTFRKIANTVGLMAALITFNSLGHAEPHLPPHGLTAPNALGQAMVVFAPNPATGPVFYEDADRWMAPPLWGAAKRSRSIAITFRLLEIRIGMEKSHIHRAKQQAVFDTDAAEQAEQNIDTLATMMVAYTDPKVFVPPWVAMMEDPETMIPAYNALQICAKAGTMAPEEVAQVPIAVSCAYNVALPGGMELQLTRADGLIVGHSGPSTLGSTAFRAATPPVR